MKLTKHWPFQAFYWDYVCGILVASVGWGVIFGGQDLFARLLHSDAASILFALAGGAVFNIANILLVAAIAISGMAVAFPVGIGLALVVGASLNYLLAPAANPILLSIGILLVLIGIVLDAMAYKQREQTISQDSARGITLSIAAGVLMGLFYPLVTRAFAGHRPLDSYTVSVCFAVGVALCSIPTNWFMMLRPLDKSPLVRWASYTQAPWKWHAAALLGGVIWETGAASNFIASRAKLVGPATSYSLGQGATLVSALWGIFVWKEFAGAPASSRRLLIFMFLFLIVGLTVVGCAPLF
jgi:glucose uptake protein